ncbi:MAG: CopD family protein [Magnetococcales bacterium]|nr:CopD family protein [Magnetococcales bacterium]
MSYLLTIHLLAVLVWVGGMFFAHFVLRPSAEFLSLPERINLWFQVLGRFMKLVWVAVLVLPLSGYLLVFRYYGGMAGLGFHIHLMQGIGLLMIGLFFYIFFGPYKQFKIRVKEELFPEAGMFMLKIRRIVGINLFLGIVTSIVAVAGRYFV